MSVLRTIASAIAILVGSALVVAWLVASALVNTVEDGSAARGLAQAAVRSPVVMGQVSTALYERAAESLRDVGLDVEALGVDGAVRLAADTVTGSDEFEQVLLDSVDAASDQFHRELTDPSRPLSPFAIEIDANKTVSAELSSVPVVGDRLAEVRLQPVSVEVLSAESFEKARDSYKKLEFAKRGFLWVGIACLAMGLIVSTRKRYVVGKFLIAIGAFALLAGLMLAVATPDRLVELAPGDAGGTWGSLAADALRGERVPQLRTLLLLVGSSALIVGAAVSAWAYRAGRRR